MMRGEVRLMDALCAQPLRTENKRMTNKFLCRCSLLLGAVLVALSGLGSAVAADASDVLAIVSISNDDETAQAAESAPAAELEVVATSQGQASFYAARLKGRRTASGEPYDPTALTAAHRSLPFGTWVRVRSLLSGHEVTVRINDRGPYTRGRVIDLSRAAAEALGMVQAGSHAVRVQVLGESKP